MLDNYLSEYGVSVLGGALFLALACIFAVWIDRLTRHVLIKRANIDPAVATLLARTLRISIFVLAGIAVLEELGVEIASLIAALGIFGFAIAIGFRTTANNFFTGVMIFILKPYKVGDYINGERVDGIVESMSLFHTVIVTDDGTYTAVPNGAIWSRSIKNFSRSRPRRLEFDIAVGRNVPFEEFGPLIEKTLTEAPMLITEFVPKLQILDVSEQELKIRAAVWCLAHQVWDVSQDLERRLRDCLATAGIEVHAISKAARPKKAKRKSVAPPKDADLSAREDI